MNSNSNEMLTALSRVWKWEGDWMTCRACKRHLIASRDGEPFLHADGCVHSGVVHPWQALRDVLTMQSSRTAPIYEVDERGLFCKHCGRASVRHGANRQCETTAQSPSVEPLATAVCLWIERRREELSKQGITDGHYIADLCLLEEVLNDCVAGAISTKPPQPLPCSCTTYCKHAGYPDPPLSRGYVCREKTA